MTGSQFSAADAALGYAYQIRIALLYALRQARDGVSFQVGVETLDDVAFVTTGGNAFELLQTKHHLKSHASLTNASEDLWKTLRVWIDGRARGDVPASARLCLITTASVSPASAASYLCLEGRDVEAAERALTSTASSSTSTANKIAYQDFLGLSTTERLALLGQAVILDSSPTIEDVNEELQRQVRWLAPKENEDVFLEYLEGWWLQRVLKQLTQTAPLIESDELEVKLEDLREQFKRDSLPIDDDVLEFQVTQALAESCQGKLFVKQIELVSSNAKRIAAAIRDYYRAYEQRSRWIRQDVVRGLEMDKYERRLIEEWELSFEGFCDEIGRDASSEAMAKAGVSILRWAEQATIPIRKNVTEYFVCRGSLHMLADSGRVGWHPKFRERLAELLGDGGVA